MDSEKPCQVTDLAVSTLSQIANRFVDCLRLNDRQLYHACFLSAPDVFATMKRILFLIGSQGRQVFNNEIAEDN